MKKDISKNTSPAIFWGAAAVVIILWALNYILLNESTDRGTIGDMFGAVNALFSGLAFAGLAYAIILQRDEVATAKKELIYTKSILDEQQQQLAIQNEQTKKQAFENTFFQMLKLFSDLTLQMGLSEHQTGNPGGTKGKDIFPFFIQTLSAYYRLHTNTTLDTVARFHQAYLKFYKTRNAELGHYFRVLYNIIKYIDRSNMNDKRFYSNLLRAQLSDAEAALLFHNGLSVYGNEKFKTYIEKYTLLKNVNDEDLVDPALRDLYKHEAFNKNTAS